MKFLKKKNIINLIKLTIICLNIVAFFYLFSFYDKYVYSSIVVDEDYIAEQSKQISDDIDIEKFNTTLLHLSNRGKIKKDSNIINFFK